MLQFIRWMTAIAVVGLLGLMLGPFQRIEQESGISDKVAHILAFGIVTVALLVNFRHLSPWTVASLAFALAILVEGGQGLLGRDAELADLFAGSIGIAVVTLLRLWRHPLIRP